MLLKKWYQSRTIWGAIISMASGALAAIGIVLTNADQKELADLIVQTISVMGPVVGGWTAFYGRKKAKAVIE